MHTFESNDVGTVHRFPLDLGVITPPSRAELHYLIKKAGSKNAR
jgi:hypothetical protein